MKGWQVFVTVGLILMLVAGGITYSSLRSSRLQLESQRDCFGRLETVVESFHDKVVGAPITGESATLGKGASELCRAAEKSHDELVRLRAEFESKSKPCLQLSEAMDKTEKYIDSYPDMVHKSVEKDRVKERAETMLGCMSACASKLGAISKIDKSDTGEAVERTATLLAAIEKASKPKVEPSAPTVQYVSSEYWRDPGFASYRSSIARIVADYSNGRAVLNRVLTHYDNRSYSRADDQDWTNELYRRKRLLRDLDSLEREIPYGSIYQEHHNQLYKMISGAVYEMERFANDVTATNRARISSLSSRNSAIMAKLRAFYGIR